MSAELRYPRPPELARLGPGCHVVESSAGTGKTFLLEHLFVDLVLGQGIPADRILVVTFTEKATAELVLRLRRLLGELVGLRPDHPKALAAHAADADAAWVIDARARQLLGDALLAFDRIDILTIHAFCQRVLREHAFVQGRLFDEELVGTETVFAEAFADVLRTRVAKEPSLAATLDAWLASGETTASLRDLLLACDRARARDLRPQLDEPRLRAALAAWLPVAASDARLQAALKAARVHPSTSKTVLGQLELVSQSAAQSHGDPLRFLAVVHAAGEVDFAYLRDKLGGLAADPTLGPLARRASDLAVAAVPLAAVAAQRFLPVVQARATRGKRTTGRFDFEDMLALVDRALADPGPAGRALAASLRRRYRHALIDEFQDTDEIQWSIFRRIFVEAGGQHGLTVIGDPKQAIYGFRGANVFTYLEAHRALQSGGQPGLVLDRNFRSTADLVAATNLIFEQGAGFFRPGSGISYDHPVQCGRPQRRLVGGSGKAAAPVVVFGLETAQKKLKADDARAAVLQAIVRELGEILNHADRLGLCDGGPPRALRERDVFVLTFTNAESQAVGRALADARIPYAFYKQDKLFQTTEAKEILDVLRALCAPEDRALRARALLTRFFGLDLPEVVAAAELGAAAGPAQLLMRLAALAKTADVPALFAALIQETGVLRRELFANAGERGLTNLTHVFELLQAEWASRHASLPELVERLAGFCRGSGAPPSRDSDLQRLETDSSAVQILTVHKAKGLEADVVFLFGGTGEKSGRDVRVIHEGSARVAYVGPVEGETKTRFAAEQDDERCRLLYVALTRARYRLYLPHYPQGKMRLRGPYTRLHQRLDEIFAAPPTVGLERRRVAAAAGHGDGLGEPPRAQAEAVDVTPDMVALLGAPTVPGDIDEIRARRKGFWVTSYTAVKRARQGQHPAEEADLRLLPGEDHAAGPLAEAPLTEGLPGGADTGIFLHDILAKVALDELASRPDLATWLSRPRVASLLERQRRLHGRAAEEIAPAARLVHTAYTAPLRLGEKLMGGLGTATSALREMEFHFPMPERAHPLLSRPGASGGDNAGDQHGDRPWRIERGVVKGFLDLLFLDAGRVYVCDWKSDLLPSYAEADLARHCRQHYDVQARLYTLAALRLCNIADAEAYGRRFGSVFFYFLRGRRPDDERAGIFGFAPTWQDILAWETEMLDQAFWGLAR